MTPMSEVIYANRYSSTAEHFFISVAHCNIRTFMKKVITYFDYLILK